nr:C40 family peptidase [Desemzia sp. RIT 804]
MTFSSLILPTQVAAEQYTDKIEEAQEKAENTQLLINEKNNQLNQIQSQVSTTENELKSITNDIKNNEEKTAALAKDIEKAQKEMQTLKAEIEVLEAKIAQRNEKLKEQARTVQTSGYSQNYIDFILESESLADIIGRIDVITDLVDANKSLVQEQIADQEAVVKKSEQTEQKINQQNAIAMELEQTRTEMDKQLLEKEVLVAQLAMEKATTEEDISAFLAQKEAAEQEVAQFTSIQTEVEAQLVREEEERIEAEEAAQLAAAEQEESSVSSEEVVQEESVATTVSETSDNVSTTESSVTESTSSSTTETATSQNNNQTSQTNQAAAQEREKEAQAKAQAEREQQAKAQREREKAQQEAAQKAKEEAEKKKEQETAPVVSSGSVLQVAGSLTGQGIPYRWGGRTTSGFDCSGFTQYVFAKAGKTIPSNSGAQYASSTKVTSPQPGDLVFFSNNGSPSGIFHVTIYTGNGSMVGSQSSTGPAYVSNFKSNVYWGNFSVFYGRY